MSRAIVLAAGKGTRMKSAHPKVLHDLCGRPMLWYVLEALRATGIDQIVVVANEDLKPQLAEFGVTCVVQTPQRGTGHAVQVALDALEPRNATLVVAYGDMPLVDATIFEDVQAAVDADAGTALGLVTARMPLPSKVMRIGRTPDNDLVVSDLGVSRNHAELRKSPTGRYEIIDLGSHNGTFVNGSRIDRVELGDSDIISIGHATFRFSSGELRPYAGESPGGALIPFCVQL